MDQPIDPRRREQQPAPAPESDAGRARRRVTDVERAEWPDGQRTEVRECRDTQEVGLGEFHTDHVHQPFVTADGVAVHSVTEIGCCHTCGSLFHRARIVWCGGCGKPVCVACRTEVQRQFFCKPCGKTARRKLLWRGLLGWAWQSRE